MKSKEEELNELLNLEKDTREAMLNMLEDIEEQKNEIENSNREWIDAFDAIDDAVMLHDKYHNIMRVNRAYKELSEAAKYKHIIGKPYFNVFPITGSPMDSCITSKNEGKMAQEEFTHNDGRIFKSRTYPIHNEDSSYNYGIHIFEDITKEREQEHNITELNKTLRLISSCNEILVRSITEQELISKVSTEIIDDDAYDFVGIYLKTDTSIFCDSYEYTKGDLSNLKKINLLDDKYKNCPTTKCVMEDIAITINDIENDLQWSEAIKNSKDLSPASEFNMRGSMLLLPLSNIEMIGAMVIYSRHISYFDESKVNLFTELSEDTAYGIHTLRLREEIIKTSKQRDESLKKLRDSLDGTVESIAMMVEARDPYTAGHQIRVADIAAAIAKELGLDQDTIEGIKIASTVHDIGKIQLPSEILTKPTRLTELEYEMIKTHSQTGYEILKNIHFPWPVAQIVHQHHEKIDGSGYPNGLKDDEILLEAKILCVADVVEAMASHRPYRASLGIEFALGELEKNKGTSYDAEVVDCCLKLFREKNYKLLDNK